MTTVDWSAPTSVDVLTAEGDENGDFPYIEMRWEADDATVTAQIDYVDGALRVTRFDISGPSGVPTNLRRLPSDSLVLKALRTGGQAGYRAAVDIAGYWDSEWRMLDEIERSSPDPETDLKRAMSDFLTDLNKRPRSRIVSQTQEVRGMLKTGMRTKEIVEALMATGVSESTAYRRIRLARDV